MGDPDFTGIIRDHLHSRIDVDSAVKQICNRLPDRKTDMNLWHCSMEALWIDVLLVAETIPHNHAMHVVLARLVTKLRSDTRTQECNHLSPPPETELMWTSPPSGLPELLRGQFIMPYWSRPKDALPPDFCRAFVAILYAMNSDMDHSNFCEWTFADTFGHSASEVARSIAKPAQVESRNYLVASAALWIMHADQNVFRTFFGYAPQEVV